MNLETYCHYLSSTLTGLEIGAQYMARDCVLWRSYFRGQTSCRIDEFRQKVDRVVDPEWYYQDEIRKGSAQLVKDKFVRTFLKILLAVPETQSVGKNLPKDSICITGIFQPFVMLLILSANGFGILEMIIIENCFK